jgi:hypothetical protein
MNQSQNGWAKLDVVISSIPSIVEIDAYVRVEIMEVVGDFGFMFSIRVYTYFIHVIKLKICRII